MSSAIPSTPVSLDCCPGCDAKVIPESSQTNGPMPCPKCAVSLWIFRDQAGLQVFRKDIADKVLNAIAGKMEVEKAKLTPSLSFFDDLGADSLDVAEMSMQLEEDFDIVFPDQDAESIRTVGDAIRMVERCLKRKKQ